MIGPFEKDAILKGNRILYGGKLNTQINFMDENKGED